MGKSIRPKHKIPFGENQQDIYIRILTCYPSHSYYIDNKPYYVIPYNNFTYLHYWYTEDKNQITIDYRLSHSKEAIDIPHHDHTGIQLTSP